VTSGRFRANPNYVMYVDLLHRLHALIQAGKGDDGEADEVRDEMDAPWNGMDSEEILRVRGISSDLYTLGPDSPIRHSERERYITDAMSARLAPLVLSRSWNRVLDELREFSGEISWDLAAQYRAEAYAKLGEGDVAKKFLAEAWRLNPQLPDLQFVDAGIRGILL